MKKSKTTYSPHNNFSKEVKKKAKSNGLTQARLTEKSQLSKTTIGRIYRNTNDKGGTYTPTLQVVFAVGMALQLSRDEAMELLYTAFPEMALWLQFLDDGLDFFEANEILYDLGLSTWGNSIED